MTDNLTERMATAHQALLFPAIEMLDNDPEKRLTTLWGAVRRLYVHQAPELLIDGLTVLLTGGAPLPLDLAESSVRTAEEIAAMRLTGMTVVIQADHRFRVWPVALSEDHIPADAFAYRYSNPVAGCSIELLVADGQIHSVPNIGGGITDLSARGFNELSEALLHYRRISSRPLCAHLNRTWRDSNRLAFRAKPEADMRRSLEYFLSVYLRGVQVRPEQNASETEPYDIEVQWLGVLRLALIEIKWLGDSAPAGSDHWTTSYRDARAVEGANQLAHYLDEIADRVPAGTMGWLVVFDARRRGLTPSVESIDAASAGYYRTRDVQYPDAVLSRPDFAEPVRIFIEVA